MAEGDQRGVTAGDLYCLSWIVWIVSDHSREQNKRNRDPEGVGSKRAAIILYTQPANLADLVIICRDFTAGGCLYIKQLASEFCLPHQFAVEHFSDRCIDWLCMFGGCSELSYLKSGEE